MGGFLSHDGRQMLSREDIESLVRNEAIVYPIVSKEEIQDRSKGDAVTKALVLSQTTWFLLQCAARGSQRLALTELELATAAFAFVNIIIYVLWWDKPLDVRCAVRVRRRSAQDDDGNPPYVNDEPRQDQDQVGGSSGWSWGEAVGYKMMRSFDRMNGSWLCR